MTDFGLYLDNYKGTDVTVGEQDAQLNWALRIIGKRIKPYHPRITLTLDTPVSGTNGAVFNLRDTTDTVSHKVLKPRYVMVSGNVLLDVNGYPGLWSIDQLHRERPYFQRSSSGSATTVAVFFTNGRLLLDPPPAGTETNNFISGTYLPANMTADSSEPDIPEEIHECIAFLAAVKAALPSATEAEQWNRLQVYNAEWMALVEDIARENANAMTGNWEDNAFVYPRYIMT